MAARIWLNEPSLNELNRILDEEVSRMLASRRALIEECGSGNWKVTNANAALRRVQEIRKQAQGAARRRGWGDYAGDGVAYAQPAAQAQIGV